MNQASLLGDTRVKHAILFVYMDKRFAYMDPYFSGTKSGRVVLIEILLFYNCKINNIICMRCNEQSSCT